MAPYTACFRNASYKRGLPVTPHRFKSLITYYWKTISDRIFKTLFLVLYFKFFSKPVTEFYAKQFLDLSLFISNIFKRLSSASGIAAWQITLTLWSSIEMLMGSVGYEFGQDKAGWLVFAPWSLGSQQSLMQMSGDENYPPAVQWSATIYLNLHQLQVNIIHNFLLSHTSHILNVHYPHVASGYPVGLCVHIEHFHPHRMFSWTVPI